MDLVSCRSLPFLPLAYISCFIFLLCFVFLLFLFDDVSGNSSGLLWDGGLLHPLTYSLYIMSEGNGMEGHGLTDLLIDGHEYGIGSVLGGLEGRSYSLYT